MKLVAGQHFAQVRHFLSGDDAFCLQADNSPEHRRPVGEHLASMAAGSAREAELLRELSKVKESSAKEIRQLKEQLDDALQV